MKKALLIGINDYPAGNELTGCIEDINNVKAVIERHGDGSPNFGVKMMPNVQTSGEVMEAIQKLFAGDNDTALLYFSGHGYANNTGAEIVMPQDISTPGLYYTGIQMSTIMNIVNNSHVHNKVVILDCCHSGNMGKYNLQDAGSILKIILPHISRMNITIGGVYAYIDRSFGPWDQRPVFKTNVTEFAPLRKVEPQVSLSVIRELTNLFVDPNKDIALDPSFEDTNDPSVHHEYVIPYADLNNVKKFKLLQKLQSIGFVKPIDEEFMYFAAMHSTGCKLTELGKYYWRLVNEGRI